MKKNNKIQEKIKDFKSMLKSCFAYGSIAKNSYYYERYLLKYKDRLGEKLFNKVYEEHKKHLQENYMVVYDTYTDRENVSYNTLVKINQ